MSALLLCPTPGGIAADGSAVLRVVVVPRLDAGTLADNGLATWPPPELRTPLTVTFVPASGAPVTVEATPRVQDQEGLWPLVFGRATVTPALRRATAGAADPVTVSPTSGLVAGVDGSFRAAAQAYATAATSDPPGARDAYASAVGRQLQSPTWAPPVISLGPPEPLADPVPPPSVPPTDVHRIYGLLREHPRVLVALGLIVELDLPPGSVPPGDGTVRVDWPAAATVLPLLPPVVPRSTAYVGEVFLPAAQDPADVDHGVVPLDDTTRWQLAAVDAESAALRMGAPARSGPDPVLDVLPALRTAGLLLLRVDRQQAFDARRSRSLAVAADDDPVLYAEDLVLGYRIDVREAGETAWHPLCERQATYRIDDTLVGVPDQPEEGHVKVHSAVRGTDGRLRADEVVTRWDGWSLAVPRPFPLRTPGRPGSGADPTDPADPAALPYRLTTDFAVPPGSLPPLRFGRSYELRARVADIAGGGVEPGAVTTDDHAAPAFRFTRYEPVSSPGLTPPDDADPAALGPGVHVTQLVVVSAGGDPSGGAVEPPTDGQTRRTLTRPTVALTTADWHGALTGDADLTWPLVQLADAQQLPDPAAVGLSASVVPGAGATPTDPVVRVWPAWPETTGTTVQLQAADGDTPVLQWTDAGLVVSLAPAQELTVQIASTVADADLGRLAVSGWSDATGVGHGTDAGLTAVTVGQHPMVTPATTLSCVHAVRRPLQGASGTVTLDRSTGVTAVLTPTRPVFGVDTASTGQIDVTASWTEVSDGPEVPQGDAPARRALVDLPVQSVVVHRGDTTTDAVEHHLPDPRHRDVTYQVTAVSRFRGFFPEGPDEGFAATALTVTLDVPSTENPAPPKVVSVVPAFVWERTPGPTTTHVRRGNRIRVEVDRPWFHSGDDERIALVMTRPGPGATTTDVTELGRDPSIPTVTPTRYPLASAVQGSGDPAATVVRAADGQSVDVVPAEVFYDPVAGHWFADFTLPDAAGGSYWPMLRPALARYQRHSLAGRELSSVVLGDFVPLLPDRTLTVTVEGDEITVTLSGVTPQNQGAWGNVVVVAYERSSDETTPAQLHRTGPGLFPVVPDVRYGAVGEAIRYTVPADHSVGRVRVHEIEQRVVPDPQYDPPDPPYLGASTEAGSRSVFVDVVALPAPSTP